MPKSTTHWNSILFCLQKFHKIQNIINNLDLLHRRANNRCSLRINTVPGPRAHSYHPPNTKHKPKATVSERRVHKARTSLRRVLTIPYRASWTRAWDGAPSTGWSRAAAAPWAAAAAPRAAPTRRARRRPGTSPAAATTWRPPAAPCWRGTTIWHTQHNPLTRTVTRHKIILRIEWTFLMNPVIPLPRLRLYQHLRYWTCHVFLQSS